MQQSGSSKPTLMSDCIGHVECRIEVPYSVLCENGNNTNNTNYTRGRYAAAYRLAASSHGVDALSVPPPLPDSPTPDLLRASSHSLPNGLSRSVVVYCGCTVIVSPSDTVISSPTPGKWVAKITHPRPPLKSTFQS